MTEPTYEHRPCPKCGATIGRQRGAPLRCYCGAALRPRIVWTVLQVHDDGICLGGGMQARVPRAVAVKQVQDLRTLGTGKVRIFAECDCGWESEQHTSWSGLDPNVAYHRHTHQRDCTSVKSPSSTPEPIKRRKP